MKKTERKIEVLPYPEGYLVAVFITGVNNPQKEADKIRESVMADLAGRGYTPKPNGVQWKGGGYCFEVAVQDETPQLLEDLKQALSKTQKGR